MCPVPQTVVYCDESSHDASPAHPFMAIGGLWVPRESRDALSRQLRALAREQGLRGEIKWRKVSRKRLEAYSRVVDFFFAREDLRFRAIVVEQADVDLEAFHGRDRELAFYKFYYEMLEKWLVPGREYLILLDRKTNRGADRYGTLARCLANAVRGEAWIKDVTVIESSQTPLAQLCDVLTGSIAAAYNGVVGKGSAKTTLMEHIAHRTGLGTLKASTALSEGKLNIFRIRLD